MTSSSTPPRSTWAEGDSGTSNNDFWDDPDVKASGNFQRFETPGTTWGPHTVTHLGKKKWDDGSISIEIHAEDQDTPILSASQVGLKRALTEMKPRAGDTLTVRFADVERRPGGKTLKLWNVSLRRADGSSQTVDQTATSP